MTPLVAVLAVCIIFLVMWIWTKNKRLQRSIDSLSNRITTCYQIAFKAADNVSEVSRLKNSEFYNSLASTGFPRKFTGKGLLTHSPLKDGSDTLILKLL